MPLNLNNQKWIGFKIQDLFTVSKGVYLPKNNILKGKSPYITATTYCNGISDFIGNNTLFPSNTITIEKVKLSSFYQPTSFYCSHDVSTLSHKALNKPVSLFITTMINRQGNKYSYGRQAQLNVVKRETTFLPVSEGGKPNWNFMHDYSAKLLNKKQDYYKKYCEDILKQLEYKTIEPLSEKQWHEFFIKDLFPSIQRGKRLIKAHQEEGYTPYISSTAANNGVDEFIGNDLGVRKFSNCLTIANSGSVGACFFHHYEFVASDHVTHLKNATFSKYIYLFISAQLSKLSSKYNFNREINDKRIAREKVLLPINDDNQPDYEYMKQYMINLEFKKRKQYLIFIESKAENIKNLTVNECM
ncbi:restriction endonuclease subunit S [Acinetobacter nosocomialis]|uniref:restriction endonuclease subunit S n=1 Tax=Acinetobacter nosocomialis TaxID=106654 RepID=UPI0032125B0F